jgi:thiol-disulfide isomerase/thioredoxin
MTNKTKLQKSGKTGLIVAVFAIVVAGVYGVYSINGDKSNIQGGETAAKAESSDVAADPTGLSKKLSTGKMVAFLVHKTRKQVPELLFKDGKGKDLKLSDWKGRVVLVNLWATWCGPCRREMPDLADLQAKLGGDDFEVVAISVDRKGIEASGKFLESVKATSLALYVDKTTVAFSKLKAVGLPLTVLVDRKGREVGRLIGPAKWNGTDAIRLIKTAIAEKL